MSELHLNKDLGFIRVAASVPALRIADVDFNADNIVRIMKSSRAEGIQILLFPEMALTGYTIGDLVHQQILLSRVNDGLQRVLKVSVGKAMVVVVGAPLAIEGKVFNCAVIINDGKILGIIPKTLLPSYKEFYEERWFASGTDTGSDTIEMLGQQIPFGTDILFKLKGFNNAIIGVEVCEDLWLPLAPHEYQSLYGANILLNLSASNEILGKADWRRTMITSESGRCIAAYCYTSSGIQESSNDVVFSGHAIIAENGQILKESQRMSVNPQLVVCDIDLDRLNHDRLVETTHRHLPGQTKTFRIIETEVQDIAANALNRSLEAHPFVPADKTRRAERCRDIFAMQVAALAEKLKGDNQSRIVFGVSGGLDSTLALLVASKTMDLLGLPRSNVNTYSLPGFGTTSRTRGNARKLCKALGVGFEQVSITRTSKSHLKDLGHGGQQDVVFENIQARYRTAFLFNKANQIGAINLGTGDLTEIALGWSTFAGDQVSHYHVNASIPKTLVQFLIHWVADEELADSPARDVLHDILLTPISPELLRPVKGKIVQKSEDVIGPVELADFFLYPFVRFGMRPGRILFMANEVNKQGLFDGKYTLDDLHKWLESFIKRFFGYQFKRTCMPEGPKVGTVSLSPRGDWRMPSDASDAIWLEDLEEMYGKLKQ